MQAPGGSDRTMTESNFMRVTGREIAAGWNTITAGTTTTTGIKTGTTTRTKITIKTGTTTTIIARNAPH
jgi:hypothetical protein